MGPLSLHVIVMCCVGCLGLVLEAVEELLGFALAGGLTVKPSVVFNLEHRVAFGWILSRQTLKQVKELWACLDLALGHRFLGILLKPPVVDITSFAEREFSVAHYEQNYTASKTINRRSFVCLFSAREQLGGHVVWRATLSSELLTVRAGINLLHSKVSDLDLHILIEEAVLEL